MAVLVLRSLSHRAHTAGRPGPDRPQSSPTLTRVVTRLSVSCQQAAAARRRKLGRLKFALATLVAAERSGVRMPMAMCGAQPRVRLELWKLSKSSARSPQDKDKDSGDTASHQDAQCSCPCVPSPHLVWTPAASVRDKEGEQRKSSLFWRRPNTAAPLQKPPRISARTGVTLFIDPPPCLPRHGVTRAGEAFSDSNWIEIVGVRTCLSI